MCKNENVMKRNIEKKNFYNKNFLLFFLLIINLSFSQVVSVGNYTFDISQKNVTIPIEISSNSEFVGFQVNLSFDSKLLSVNSVRIGEFVSSFNVLNNVVSDSIRIAGFSPNLKGISGSGILAYIDFNLLDVGSSNLILSGKISDKEGKPIKFTFLSGRINLTGQTQKQPVQSEGKPSDEKRVTQTNTFASTNISNISPSFTSSLISQTSTSPVIQPSSQVSINPVYNLPSTTITPTQPKFSPAPEDPSAKDNCILLIISEYGNPVPSNGFYTYKKGEKVECKVEKEVYIGDEKYICVGYEGYGSIEDGNENYINFIITTNTKIKWKWEKKEGEK